MPNKHSIQMIAILAMLVSLGPMATDMYLPALPTLTQVFATDMSQVQLTLSVYFVGFAVGQLVYGPLADRFGRKPILLLGLLLFALSSMAATFVTSIEALIIARLFQALGGCAGPVLGRAMVRDLYEPQEAGRVMSHISSAMALAPAIAPIIGGFLTVWFGWEATFWFLLVYGVLTIVIISVAVEETIPQKNPEATRIGQLWRNYKVLLAHQEWRLYTLICSFIFAGLFTFLSGSSFVLIDYLGMSEQQYGFLFAIVVLGYITGTQLAARFSGRYGAFTVIRFGCWLGLFAGLVLLGLSLAGVHTVSSVIGPQFFFMMAVGMVMPLTLTGAMAPFPQMAGVASALFGAVQMGIAALHGAFVGHLYTGTPTVMAAGIAFAGLMAFVAMKRLKAVQAQQAA